jgi:hypothetical protein
MKYVQTSKWASFSEKSMMATAKPEVLVTKVNDALREIGYGPL